MNIATVISDDKTVSIVSKLLAAYATVKDITDLEIINMPDNFLMFYYGKYKRLLFTVTDPSTSDPVDITGADFKFTVKGAVEDPDSSIIFQETSGSPSGGNITIISGPDGTGQIDILAADTAALPLVTRYNCVWDLQMTLIVDNPEIVAGGTCTLSIPVYIA